MTATTLDQVLIHRQANREIVNVDEPTMKLVVFALGQTWFAFHGERIREILAEATVFFVPGCPPSLEGVINVRGDIESVIRIDDLLQQPATPANQGRTILLGRGKAMSSGIRVDRVIDVIDVPASQLQPPPATTPEATRNFTLGVLQFQERPVTLLDLERIFSDYAAGLG